jgi:hypothetical protein
MTAKRIQFFVALRLFLLGGWATFFPQHVIDTVFLAEHRDGGRLLSFAIACFGALALCYVSGKKSKAIEQGMDL